MTQTIERQLHTAEQPTNLHLDLSRVSQSEYSPEKSRIVLDITEPTAESPVKIYAASPKSETQDGNIVGRSQLAVNKNGEVNWRIDTDPQSVGFVYVRSVGEPEILGASERTTHGTFTLEPGAAVFMMPNQSIGEHLEHDLLTITGLEATIADADLNTEAVKLSFEEAAASDNSRSTSRLAKRLNSQAGKRRLDLKAERAQKKNKPLSTDIPQAPVERPAGTADVTVEAHAVKNQSLEGYSRRTQARKKSTEANSLPEEISDTTEPTLVLDTTSPVNKMSDEERQYWEDEHRSFKLTDNRKWSRIEMFGHEVGPHSDVSFTVPAPKEEATTEPISSSETTPAVVQGSTAFFETIDYNPNDDPAIENGLSRLSTLRSEIASLTANRQNKLFSFNGKKSSELTKVYNEQMLALGQLVIGDKLSDDTLTESQKNVAATKFVIHEQMALQIATKEKLQGTKAGKFVEWMNIHGTVADTSLDARAIVQAIELGGPSDDKLRLAQKHMASLYHNRVRAEQFERRKEATRIMAIGVVGMAAAAFGINPSTAGDAANNIFYGARKK